MQDLKKEYTIDALSMSLHNAKKYFIKYFIHFIIDEFLKSCIDWLIS